MPRTLRPTPKNHHTFGPTKNTHEFTHPMFPETVFKIDETLTIHRIYIHRHGKNQSYVLRVEYVELPGRAHLATSPYPKRDVIVAALNFLAAKYTLFNRSGLGEATRADSHIRQGLYLQTPPTTPTKPALSED